MDTYFLSPSGLNLAWVSRLSSGWPCPTSLILFKSYPPTKTQTVLENPKTQPSGGYTQSLQASLWTISSVSSPWGLYHHDLAWICLGSPVTSPCPRSEQATWQPALFFLLSPSHRDSIINSTILQECDKKSFTVKVDNHTRTHCLRIVIGGSPYGFPYFL